MKNSRLNKLKELAEQKTIEYETNLKRKKKLNLTVADLSSYRKEKNKAVLAYRSVLGNRRKFWRINADITHDKVSEYLSIELNYNVYPMIITRIEEGKKVPSFIDLKLLDRMYGVDSSSKPTSIQIKKLLDKRVKQVDDFKELLTGKNDKQPGGTVSRVKRDIDFLQWFKDNNI